MQRFLAFEAEPWQSRGDALMARLGRAVVWPSWAEGGVTWQCQGLRWQRTAGGKFGKTYQ